MRQPMMVAITLSCGGSGGVRAVVCRMWSASGWCCQASDAHSSTGTQRTHTLRPVAALPRPRFRKCVCLSRARASARPRSRTRPASGHVKSAWFLRCHIGSGLPAWCRASPTSSPRKCSVSDLDGGAGLLCKLNAQHMQQGLDSCSQQQLQHSSRSELRIL